MIDTNHRHFCKTNKSEAKPTEEDKKENTSEKEPQEEEQREFHHDEAFDEENQANFSTGHKILIGIGKAIKYSFWTY